MESKRKGRKAEAERECERQQRPAQQPDDHGDTPPWWQIMEKITTENDEDGDHDNDKGLRSVNGEWQGRKAHTGKMCEEQRKSHDHSRLGGKTVCFDSFRNRWPAQGSSEGRPWGDLLRNATRFTAEMYKRFHILWTWFLEHLTHSVPQRLGCLFPPQHWSAKHSNHQRGNLAKGLSCVVGGTGVLILDLEQQLNELPYKRDKSALANPPDFGFCGYFNHWCCAIYEGFPLVYLQVLYSQVLYGGTVASEQGGPGFNQVWPRSFCEAFACSARVWVGFLRLPPTVQRHEGLGWVNQ